MHLVTKITWGEFKRWVDSHIESGEIKEDWQINTITLEQGSLLADLREAAPLDVDDLVLIRDKDKRSFSIITTTLAFEISPEVRKEAIAAAEVAGDHEAVAIFREMEAALDINVLLRRQ